MADASTYPITFGYGATDGVYYGPKGSVGPYHRGDDRAMPVGTPVKVNGAQIGLSGSTGASSGPHLHIGRFVNGQDTNPGGQGFSLKAPLKVTTVSEDSTNGKYVRLTDADGVQWVYLHMSQQSVAVGQLIGEEKEEMTTLTTTSLRIIEFLVGGWDGNSALNGQNDKLFTDSEGWKDPNEVIYNMFIQHGDWVHKVLAMQQGVSDTEAQKQLTALKAELKKLAES